MNKRYKIARIAGILLLITGITLIILGTVVFRTYPFNDPTWPGGDQPNFGIMIPGVFMTFIGFFTTITGFIAPSFKEMAERYREEEFQRTLSEAERMQQRLNSVNQPQAETRQQASKQRRTNCQGCGATITQGNEKFCQFCGARLD